jgi:hypothetical protein
MRRRHRPRPGDRRLLAAFDPLEYLQQVSLVRSWDAGEEPEQVRIDLDSISFIDGTLICSLSVTCGVH